ncbi:porin [Mangrovicoccus algicola]|uniref:Porin n=1 Tax=Mangrovicoccus algicola TaxID=2771008 RepID=A0A8J6ZE92_9RHOB|nr:porin [Mangrovicoccus algicola]MBE3640130.1 porin [Mangrovicoccus algicola]
MKKILLASSALVLVGGAAFAEVTLEGKASMGFIGGNTSTYDDDGVSFDGDSYGDDDARYSFVSDFDIVFNLSGETDGGVTFGASAEIDDLIGAPEFADEEDQGGESVFISGDFGTITMGDTNGAYDFAVNEYINGQPGTIGDMEETAPYRGIALSANGVALGLSDDDDEDATYASVDPLDDGLDGFYDGQVARYDYTYGGFAIAVSAELSDETEGDPVLGLGATYNLEFTGGAVKFGAAYQTVSFDDYATTTISTGDVLIRADGDISIAGVSAAMELDAGLSLDVAIANTMYDFDIEATDGANVASDNFDDDFMSYGVGIGYTFDAISVGAGYGFHDADTEIEGYSLTAAYDLGGGMALQAGYGHSEIDDEADQDVYSFGVSMNF